MKIQFIWEIWLKESVFIAVIREITLSKLSQYSPSAIPDSALKAHMEMKGVKSSFYAQNSWLKSNP